MKKHLLFSIAIIVIASIQGTFAQTNAAKKVNRYSFDEKAAIEEAKAKGVPASDILGYVKSLKNNFYARQTLAKQSHKHTPYEQAGTPSIQESVIYLEPNKPMSLGCPNMGFEQYNFNGWTGGTGTTANGAPGGSPTYVQVGTAIVNTAGNNVPPSNIINYHTIMSLPAIDPNLTTINGYDPNACKAVGTQTISEIPYVSPFSFDPVSVRMGSNDAAYKASRLKYITTASSTNQRLSFSYAVVLESPGHLSNESPYFKVEVRNETTGAILPGCTSYTFNPVSSVPSDSLKTSTQEINFVTLRYRKWQYYSVDLSTLPPGTNVSINFEVGGCTLGGHTGYAYVDAECGGIGTPYANMCSGSNFATLVAPTGFNTYQWSGPSGVIAGATNDTLILGPPSNPTPVPGTTYSVTMVSPGGCAITQTVNINFTTVNIINLNSTSSCPGGASGSAFVQANGSNGVYTYTWTNTVSGQVVSNAQTATGLPPGTYSVLVASTTCGQASANLSVGVAPAFFVGLPKSFCGNSTTIAQTGGSNYTWYQNSVAISGSAGTNDTLYINNAIAGDVYTVVYNNAQGCRDSIAYTLNQVTGGTSYFSNTTNVCPNDSNGTTIINLTTPFSAPYSYVVNGPVNSNNVLTTSSSATAITISSLAPGTYTAVISDGVCIYNNTVTIGVITTNFTMTPTNTVLCFPEEVAVKLDFGDTAPTSCALSSGSCSTPNIVQLGFGTAANSTTSYPAIYSNWYQNARHQILYRASELIAAGVQAGKISSISWNISSISGTTAYPNFTIKMKCTSAQDLTSTAFDNTALTQVYFAPTANISVGWNTYNFATAYEWDGVSNILIDVCTSLTSGFTNNSSSPYTPTTFNSVRWFNSDPTVACMTTNASNGFAPNTTFRPNIRFGNCGASNPASYTVAVSSNGTITANYSNDSIRIAPTFTVPPTAPGIVVYTISVTNPVGNCVTSQTLAILYPPLATTVVATPTTFTLCEGANTTFTASGAANYNWFYNSGGTLVPISTASVVNVTPPSVGTNTYVVTGTPICPSGTPDTKTVTVNVTPLATLLITPLVDITKCLNKDFVYNTAIGSVPTNTAATYAYSWTTLPGGLPAPGLNTSSSYTASSNSTTTLVVTVSGVCANPVSDTVVVKNFVDDLGITVSNSLTICPNTSFSLTSNTTGGHAPYSYSWTLNGNTISSTSDVTGTSPNTGGAYTISVTVIDSCSYVKSDIDIINVLPNTLNVSILDSSSTCGGSPFTLNAQASSGYPNYTYVWTFGGSVLSNNQSLNSTSPTSEGNYTVTVTATDSCGYQASDIQLINVKPPCAVEIPNIITPNGDNANDFFKIKNIEYHPNTNVTIFDRWGKKVYENPNYNNEWKGDGVSDGTFFYIIDVPDDKKYSGFITVFRN